MINNKSTDMYCVIENLPIYANNFIELRDKYEEEYDIKFITHLTDEQILNIERTSNDYEFDQIIGLIDEIESRSGIEQPKYGDEDGGEFEPWYWKAIETISSKLKSN